MGWGLSDIYDNTVGSAKDAVNNTAGSVTDVWKNLTNSFTAKNLGKAIDDTLGSVVEGVDNTLGINWLTRVKDAGLNLRDKGINPNAATQPAEKVAAVMPVMPTIDSEAVKAARKRQMLLMQNRGGRDSTILGGSSTFGG